MADELSISSLTDISAREIYFVLRVNRWLIGLCAGASVAVALVGTLMMTPQYRATAVLQVIPGSVKEVNVADVVDMEVRGMHETERFYRTELAIMKTRPLAEKVLERFHELQLDGFDGPNPVGALLSIVSVQAQERSSLIEVSVRHSDPEMAALLATLYAETYVEQNLESRRGASRGAKEWLEQKISEYEVHVASVAAEMIEFKREHDVVDLEDTVTAMSSRMDEIDSRYGEVSTERLLLQTTIAGYEALLRQDRVVELAEVLDTDTLAAMSRIYAEARTEHATIGARYGERHSRFIESQETMDRIRAELRREARAAVEAERARLSLLEAEEQSLLDAIDSVQEAQLTRQGHQAEFDQLRLTYERSEAFLRRLSTRSDELALASRTQLNNAQVREPAAVPQRPFSPNLAFNMVLGLLFGLAGGAGIAGVRHFFDETIADTEALASVTGLPVLGVVPSLPAEGLGELPDLYTAVNPRTIVAEAVRGVRALVEMQPDGKRPECLVVTSALAAEGKTGLCVRLSIAYGQLGKRAVVVDCDAHRPRVHQAFGLDNSIGLLSVLRGESDLDLAIRSTPVEDVHALTLGPRGDDTARLLATPAFAALVQELRSRFDVVLIDTPPSATLADAMQIAGLSDGVLFVSRAGKASRRVVRHTIGRFRSVGAHMLGTILNDVSTDSTGGYGYLYDYKYNYSYTESDGDPS